VRFTKKLKESRYPMSSITDPSQSIEVFYSYTHEDERFRKRLEKQLSLLKKRKGFCQKAGVAKEERDSYCEKK